MTDDTEPGTPAQNDEISEEQLEDVAGGNLRPPLETGPYIPWEPTPTFPTIPDIY